MGAAFGRWWRNMEARILFLGLDSAGKTTILYKMKLGEVVTTIPTIGFNVETISYKNFQFTAWDIGGRDKTRVLYRHYFANTDAVVFVVDCSDVERLNEVKEMVDQTMAEEQLRDSVLLVLANKQDTPNAKSPMFISELLELHKFKQNCHIIPTVAISGDGLNEAFEWLHLAITQQRKGQSSKTNVNNNLWQPESSTTACTIEDTNQWKKAWELLKTLFVAN